MSASNWSICPICVKIAEALRDIFRDKYYGKLDSYVFTQLFNEIEKALEHLQSGDEGEFKPSAEMLKLAEEKNICVDYDGIEYDSDEVLQQGNISCSLREDYELGVNDDGLIFIRYGCGCDNCGFSKSYNYEEKISKAGVGE